MWILPPALRNKDQKWPLFHPVYLLWRPNRGRVGARDAHRFLVLGKSRRPRGPTRVRKLSARPMRLQGENQGTGPPISTVGPRWRSVRAHP